MVKKSDSFFIRQTLNADNTNSYQETPIDLGAYVDALGKSVLRIHNVAVTFSDPNGKALEVTGNSSAAAQFQLLTQSQTDIVFSSNRAANCMAQTTLQVQTNSLLYHMILMYYRKCGLTVTWLLLIQYSLVVKRLVNGLQMST
jgi:hypothetical protein